MGSIQNWFLRILLVASVLTLLPFVSAWCVEFARQLGWFDTPQGLVDRGLSVVASIVDYPWYWAVGCFVAGLTIGAWILYALRLLDSKGQKAVLELGRDLEVHARVLNWYLEELQPPTRVLNPDIAILFDHLDQWRISRPNAPLSSEFASMRLYAQYFLEVGTLLKHGQIKSARKWAREFAEPKTES